MYRVENLANYPLGYIFYPERSFLPHEVKIPAALSGDLQEDEK